MKHTSFPSSCHLELTYRCPYSCIHCYCAGMGNASQELSTARWKRIIDELCALGCLSLTLSGGEPLVRDDFPLLYTYAKRKGFLVSVLTNASLIDEELAALFEQYPPLSVEATVYAATPQTYEAVTGHAEGFEAAIRGVKLLKAHNVATIMKAVCLKRNQHELIALKHLAEQLLGKPDNGTYRFKYDYALLPHLNGDLGPCAQRVTMQELRVLVQEDEEMRKDFVRVRVCEAPGRTDDRSLKYFCNSWMHQFAIDPFGWVKFCLFSKEHAFHIDEAPLTRYREVTAALSQERFKKKSVCGGCERRYRCLWCPARAALETGDDEAMVPYYCQLSGVHEAQCA